MEGNATELDLEAENAIEEAAFAASFNDDEVIQTVTISTEKETPSPEEKTEEATPVPAPLAPAISDEQMRLLAALPELERKLTQQVDKVAGNYGEMKRVFDSMQKAAATPQGAAEFEASPDGDYLDREFSEIAGGVNEKIAKALSKIPTGMTAEQFDALYLERRQREEDDRKDELVEILHTAHPDRIEIQQTPEWKQWFQGLQDHQRAGVMNSMDPYYVSAMISKFKTFRDQQVTKAAKSKQRIEAAITPDGVRPTSPSTISDDEAAQTAFEDQFK